MPDRLEVAASGRAKCRACEAKIDKGALRFGEELQSGYREDGAASVFWFHLRCAAQRRPEKFAALARSEAGANLPDREALLAEAEEGLAHPRLERIAGVEQASSGRAKCRHCQQPIPLSAWRIRLSAFGETGFFDPLGFIHASCAREYFGMASVKRRLEHLAPEQDLSALEI